MCSHNIGAQNCPLVNGLIGCVVTVHMGSLTGRSFCTFLHSISLLELQNWQWSGTLPRQGNFVSGRSLLCKIQAFSMPFEVLISKWCHIFSEDLESAVVRVNAIKVPSISFAVGQNEELVCSLIAFWTQLSRKNFHLFNNSWWVSLTLDWFRSACSNSHGATITIHDFMDKHTCIVSIKWGWLRYCYKLSMVLKKSIWKMYRAWWLVEQWIVQVNWRWKRFESMFVFGPQEMCSLSRWRTRGL